MSETTPLLSDSSEHLKPKDIYDRFSRAQKRVILAVIALAGLIAPFAAGSFVPCVPEVARDLNTTGTVINYTVGVYVLMTAVGSLVWGPYAGFYGRQPVYLTSLPLLCAGSLGVSISANVPQLVIGRAIQAFGASSVMSVGAATISDIYKLEERGSAMGILFGAILLGPALAPLTGGVAATYASWRVMQLILFGMGVVSFVCITIFLPETSHPGSRGVDKLTQEGQAGLKGGSTWKWVWLSPFKALRLLRGPNILFPSMAASFTLVTDYVLLIPLSYTLAPRYGITSPALIGLCFLPSGIGNVVGAPLIGHLADRTVIRWREKRGGTWVPEDRLRATLFGASFLVPLSVLVFGLTTQFVQGTLGLVINLLCLFVNGVGVTCVLSSSSTYVVDVLRTQSAEVMAASRSNLLIFSGQTFSRFRVSTRSALRNVLCAIASASVLPVINKIGVGPTNGLAAVLGWLAFGLLWVTIRYGDRLRAWVDIGYTTNSVRDSCA